jgi:hypothetical protein
VEEVVIVSTDFARLNAESGILQCLELGECLRKKPSLNALGNVDFLSDTALGLLLFCGRPALCFNLANEVVAADQGEGVSVHVVEAGEDSSPEGGLGGMVKSHPATLPLLKLGHDIFGDEYGVPGAANQLVIFGVSPGADEGQYSTAVRGSDGDPTATRFIVFVDDQVESELVHEETKAPILIAHEYVDAEEAEIRALSIEERAELGCGIGAAHRCDYKARVHCKSCPVK